MANKYTENTEILSKEVHLAYSSNLQDEERRRKFKHLLSDLKQSHLEQMVNYQSLLVGPP